MLELIDVHHGFSGRSVLSGATCTFSEGSITGLVGDNGAGKSTLFRIATTILTPVSGTVRFHGSILTHTQLQRRCALGALIERPGHYDELSVTDNLSFFYALHADARSVPNAVADALERFGLAEVSLEPAGKLSTGYRQRLAVARAFHPGARMVLLDEPLTGLDPATRNRLKDTLRDNAARGIGIVVSSHALEDVHALCDGFYVLACERLHYFETFEDICTRWGLDPTTDLDLIYTRLMAVLQEESCQEQ